ncbi:cyclopropane-fatty-acyl-phospholipid synthase [Roseovarius sp. HI0049]|nr:cyclopropane-fatty-acyl-phospholipid synthase [Roseovarius sp. HI0049]
MPFESGAMTRRRVAVVGAGISGMGAAYELSKTQDVTIFEAEPRLGGHARTVFAGRHGDQPVDTGFIVFNHTNYPNLTRLFDDLDVPVTKSDMSFGASVRGGAVEYGLAGAAAFFAQKRNALNPWFLSLLRDIFRFNARALETVGACPDLSINEFLRHVGTGRWFREYYLLPLTGAIWSTPTQQVGAFPAKAMVRFLKNHGLLTYDGQHQWYTVEGGSMQYVDRVGAALLRRGAELRLSCPARGVRRDATGVCVKTGSGEWEHFDDIVFATHSDDSLSLLSDPSPEERAALGAVRYQPNDVVLHADASVMPRRRPVWSSWNYSESPAKRDGQIDITYWMNRLQPIPEDDPHFVTLNSNRPIREELIYDQVTLRHPVYDLAAFEAQAKLRAMNGMRNTWYCGAWMRDGFHEDGLASGLEVADAIVAKSTVPMAAE